MSIVDEFQALRANSKKYLELNPGLGERFMPYYEQVYSEGSLDTKTKRLMAMCGGLIAGCKGCIIGQMDMALQQGATVEEILETCGVAMSLGGTLAWSKISMVVEYLEENGLLD